MTARFQLRRIRTSLVLFVAALVAVPTTYADITVDFTTFTGDGFGVSQLDFNIEIDAFGNISVDDQDGFEMTATGFVNGGFDGTLRVDVDGDNSGGNNVNIRVNEGTGIGVQGSNAGQIENAPGFTQSEVMELEFQGSDMTYATLVVKELGFTNYTGAPVVTVTGFDGTTQVTDASNPSSISLSGAAFSETDTGEIGVQIFGDTILLDAGPTPGSIAGYSLASMTFDIFFGSSELLGDLDFSGTLDSTDIQMFLAGFDTSTLTDLLDFNTVDNAIAQGDINLDGIVDWYDWALMRRSFENNGVPFSLTNIVPEPTSFTLLGLAVVGLSSTARRRRN